MFLWSLNYQQHDSTRARRPGPWERPWGQPPPPAAALSLQVAAPLARLGGGLEVPVVTARQAHAAWSPRPPITTDSRSLLICRHSEQSPDDLSELAPRLLTRWNQPQPSPPLPRPRGGAEGPEGWAAHGQPAGSPILGCCCRLPRHEPLWGQHPPTCARGSQALGSPPVCACAVAAGLVPTLPPCRGPKPTSPSAAREAGARPRCHQPLASRSPRTRRRSR